MKKNITLMLAVILLMGVAGCSKNKDNNTTDNKTTADVAFTTKDVDMDKVVGKELEDVEIEGQSDEAVIGGYEVAIEEAKVIDYDEEKLLIVSFDFDNNSTKEIAFDGAMTVEVEQDGLQLRGAVVSDVEGVDISSSFETVKSGKDIKLQKAYILENETSAVNVSVYKYGESGKGMATKTFNIQ